ncbi:MAG: cupredoxin domain-containing protein [Candidatus Pacebacteria bacterium]|nr:cupredoxin domain-containing protein [Candidatus Paceibacterota bacterium]
MNKTASIIITLGLVGALGIVFLGSSKSNTGASDTGTTQNTEIKDGVQYVTIDVKGGYSPRVATAKGGIPTKLIMKTDGTYDCSSSLAINSIGYRKILPQTGETEIDLGIPKAGEPLRGVCGMGMYSFVINFE